MFLFDEKLYNLQQKAARKIHLDSLKNSLYNQRRELDSKRFQLKVAMNKEQADVDKLSKWSLTAFFYHLTGQMDEKLTKEQKEASEAKIKYDIAMQELEAIDYQIKLTREELDTLTNAETEYHQALDEKKESLKLTESPEKEEILQLEKEIASLEIQEKEIDEAISAGRTASRMVSNALSALQKAKNWGRWDILGGDTISTLAKHDNLNKAQNELGKLQIQLRHFRTELADVKIYSNLHVTVDGLSRFADLIFDNIFVDMEIQQRIKNSILSVEQTKDQIESALEKLQTMIGENQTKQEQLKARIEHILIGKGIQ